jgi:hypothetical protein
MSNIYTYGMIQREKEANVLVQVEHVLVISKVCLAQPRMVLWQD